jgi:hypothetical protein
MATQSPGISSVERKSLSRALVAFFVMWLLIAVLVVMAVTALHGPNPKPATAAANEFSAERALIHVRQIARIPHPIGSSANDAVRDYLVGQLGKLGLQTQVFSALSVNPTARPFIAGLTKDIIGQLPGDSGGPAILLMAHYDSVFRAPGAADDGASVAAILETVRALRQGPGLKRDLIVLFTDGEEEGLLGAEAFLHSDPLAKEVGLILNFEARGDRGPSLLFETSRNNQALLDGIARARTHVTGSSLFYELYKLLPNDTDLTIFRPSGVPALNFAFGEGLQAYHSPLDTPENLSPASLQNHGSYALALTRYFGESDLVDLKKSRSDDVFFDWFGGNLIVYGQRWVLPGEALATILVIFCVLLAIRRAEVRTTRFLLALVACLAFLVLIPAIVAGGWLIINFLLGGHAIFGDASANLWLLGGLTLLGACAGTLLAILSFKYFAGRELSLAGLVIWCVCSWLVALWLPSASYLLFWPLLLGVAGALASQFMRRRTGSPWIGSLVGVACAILFFAPLAYLLYIFLTFGLISALASALLLGLFFLLAVPLIEATITARWWGIGFLAAASVVCLAVGVMSSHYTAEHPQRDTIVYSLNADDNTAVWISYDQRPDGWTRQFLTGTPSARHPVPNYLAGLQSRVLSAPAPVVQLAPPVIENIVNKTQGDTHQLKMTLKSPRGADALYLRFPSDVQPISAKVAGRDFPVQKGKPFGFTLYGMKTEGVDLELTLEAPSTLSFWVMDRSSGLPLNSQPRPNTFIGPEGSDVTFVCRKYTF